MSIGKIQVVDNQKQYVRFATLGGAGSGEASGIQLGNVQDLTLKESTGHLTLSWKDPEDVVFNGEKIAEWAGTKVVRKEGSSPESVEDGILIADSTVRDQYSVDGLQDADVAAGTQYNYTLFPYTAKNVYTMSDLNKISGSLLSYDPILENNTWAQIAEASKAGIAKDIWNLNDVKGDYIIAGFDHDDLADGSGKAGITFLQNNIDTCPKGIWGAASTWVDSAARGTLSEVYHALDEEIKNAIVTVKKDYKRAYDSYYYNYVDEHLFLLSMNETGQNTQYSEGKSYVGAKIGGNFGENANWSRTTSMDSSSYACTYNVSSGKISFRSNVSKTSSNYLRYAFCV